MSKVIPVFHFEYGYVANFFHWDLVVDSSKDVIIYEQVCNTFFLKTKTSK